MSIQTSQEEEDMSPSLMQLLIHLSNSNNSNKYFLITLIMQNWTVIFTKSCLFSIQHFINWAECFWYQKCNVFLCQTKISAGFSCFDQCINWNWMLLTIAIQKIFIHTLGLKFNKSLNEDSNLFCMHVWVTHVCRCNTLLLNFAFFFSIHCDLFWRCVITFSIYTCLICLSGIHEGTGSELKY